MSAGDGGMKVLLDCRMASWTGVGRYTTGLVRALARRGDLELVLLCARDSEDLVASDRARTVFSGGNPLSLGGMLAFGDIVGAERPDLTHCLHFPTPLPARRPLIVTLHDLTPLLVDGVMGSGAKRAVYRTLNARAARMSDAIITPSTHTAHDVERVFHRAQGKTRVVLESADDFSAGGIGPLPTAVSALAGAPYVLSMGSTRPHKDLPTLLEAFAVAAKRREDLRLVLVGRENSELTRQVLGSRPLIQQRILWTGRVSDPELRALYANAAVFVFPSLYEGFGLPPLEAMAMGAPVVVSDASSLPEVVGDAGLLVGARDVAGFADAMVRVLDDSELRECLLAAGAKRAAQLTWDAAAATTVEVYRAALASGTG